MELFWETFSFLLKAGILVVSFLICLLAIVAISSKSKSKEKGTLKAKKLNESLKELAQTVEKIYYDKKALKSRVKAIKKNKSNFDKKLFLLRFFGDLKASSVESLRHEVTSLLQVAEKNDEVLICIESPGGMPHGYGLAASQLVRIREKGIKVTACIDMVAASGGYMMACVADEIIAAPFAIVGSIGVVGQVPNFHKLLKKHNIDFEQHTAGEYKRTLTMFGEVTEKERKKFKADLEELHHFFKNHVESYRPRMDIERVATGEYWVGTKALELGLVDRLGTSDDVLCERAKDTDIIELQYKAKKSLSAKLSDSINQTLTHMAAW